MAASVSRATKVHSRSAADNSEVCPVKGGVKSGSERGQFHPKSRCDSTTGGMDKPCTVLQEGADVTNQHPHIHRDR